jgi:hypothetical protein
MTDVLFIQGMGIVCFLLFYFSNSLDDEHVFLKLAANLFGVSMILVIPAFLIHSGTALTLAAPMQTLLQTFYKVFQGLIVVVWGYVFVYLNYFIWLKKILIKFKRIIPKESK